MKLPYWIQRADFSARDFDAVDLVAAEQVLRDHDWRTELAFLGSLESRGKNVREDCCPPSVGFIRGDVILQFCPNQDRTADCYLLGAISSYAKAKAERHGNVFVVNDPDASRSIDNAPLLLQYRILQLHFRPDDDALLYLFDEYLTPSSH